MEVKRETKLALLAASLLPLLLLLSPPSPIACQVALEDPTDDFDSYNASEYLSAVESLFGQVAKGVVYGGAALFRLNNRLLCPLLKHETDRQNNDQPILYVFNDFRNKQRAFRIYADDEITPWMVNVAQFDPNQMTFVFVHGWLGGIHNELWLSQAKNKILSVSERLSRLPSNESSEESGSERPRSSSFAPNVIVVEWSDFALGTLYTATQNSYKVSDRLGLLLGQLAAVGAIKPELTHCLGHSIGAHICGRAARTAFPAGNRSGGLAGRPARLGRISGLDPGGFCYELGVKNESAYLGLRPSDALLVDAYYSNRSPFGNKFKVTPFNVRINNGFFQAACSVWLNPEVAADYFKAAIRFSTGDIGNNDMLTCDHYFATRFASLTPASAGRPSCSFMAYACDSYRNFLRGRCGLCNSLTQCYPMDFEYQRGPEEAPSVGGALKHIQRYSAELDHPDLKADPNYEALAEELGHQDGLAYTKRRVYYLRIPKSDPFCIQEPYYRLRVRLREELLQMSGFRNNWIQVRLYPAGNDSSVLRVRNLEGKQASTSVDLHGPWQLQPAEELALGLDPNTLTGMFEPLWDELGEDDRKIDRLSVVYRNKQNAPEEQLHNPIELIELNYLSSTNDR